MRLERRLDLLQRHDRAPVALHGMHHAAGAAHDLAEQMTETAEDRHQHRIAGGDQRHEDGLDAGARRAVDQERPAVLRLIDAPVQLHRLVHVGGERRVELAEERHRHRPQDAWVGLDRPRSQEDARRWVEIGDR